MKVKDVMSAGSLKSCSPETKLAKAAKIMKEVNVGALPVTDNSNKVIGIVTDRDICLSFAEKGNKPASAISIKEILPKAKIRTVTTEDNIADVLREMRKNKIGRLPVTDQEGKLKGMVSVNNLLSRAVKRKEELGHITSKDENLAKTIKALFERNNSKVLNKKNKELALEPSA